MNRKHSLTFVCPPVDRRALRYSIVGALAAGVVVLLASSPTMAQKRSFSELKAEAKERAERRALNAKAVRTKQKKDACRCATPRLVAPRGPIVLDETSPLSAWLDDSGARIDLFLNKDLGRGLRPAPLPVVQDIDAPPGADGGPVPPKESLLPSKIAPVELTPEERKLGESLQLTPFPLEQFGTPEKSRAKFVRLWMNAPLITPSLVGLLRKQDQVPRDVVRVGVATGLDAPPPPGKAPELLAAFLGPLEARETPGCGKTVTHRLVANAAEGSPKVAGWLVKRTDATGEGRVALVDARQAVVFGVGRVEGCGQGLTLSSTDPMTLEIRPVSSTFGVGDAWIYETHGPEVAAKSADEDGDDDEAKKTALPTLTTAPASQKIGMSNPFVDGFTPRKLSGSKDRVAFGSMAFVVGGAVVIAALWYSLRKRRKRRIEVHGCPACGEEMSLDVADPQTDGFFCPSCGKSSVTVSQTPNGPRVRVYPLDAKS